MSKVLTTGLYSQSKTEKENQKNKKSPLLSVYPLQSSLHLVYLVKKKYMINNDDLDIILSQVLEEVKDNKGIY